MMENLKWRDVAKVRMHMAICYACIYAVAIVAHKIGRPDLTNSIAAFIEENPVDRLYGSVPVAPEESPTRVARKWITGKRKVCRHRHLFVCYPSAPRAWREIKGNLEER